MLNLPLYQVDAFADRLFGGNPAAVVVLEEWLEDGLLQSIAAENNLSETAFVVPGREVCRLRWFTPTLEMDLCGHATLAAAHVLFRHYFPGREKLAFATLGGELVVDRTGNVLTLDFPARPGRPVQVDDALVEALGNRPREAYLARDLLVVFDSEQEVLAFRPDVDRIAELDAFALIITAPGSRADFVSRFFAPRAGVVEDPVTGSAHCTLIPYWAGRLGKDVLTARQLSQRGGELYCENRGDRVRIGGTVIDYLKGEITVP